MSMALQTLAAITSSLTDGACTVRIGRDVISSAHCSGLDDIRAETEEGVALGYSGNIRYLLADEPSVAKSGAVVEVKRTHDADYIKVRVAARHVIGGVVRLAVAAEYA